ncbi:trypsin-like serine protease [Kibdelosporangium persicum]|uniref:Serine protease n=1 Tax=Kibdelosporangium persicum TaxID=2698649 RepID=A0ABX2F0N7_9PSEU|nr:trypsin-like serine protease [Kibdelosporangium persicum]NRN64842.1 Poly(L-lactic acid) depolymerase [Kibdelosporangium persicum]
MKFARLGMALAGVTLAVMGIAAPAASAAPVAEPTDVTPMIIGGGNASNAPWAARLFRNGQQNCTATVIAPNYVLTAQHCVAGSGTYTFRIGSLDQTSGGQMRTAAQITTHPTADLAIARLSQPYQGTYSPLGTTSNVAVNQTVQVYGWGATCTGQPEINCQSRYLKVANVRVTSVSCSDYRGGIAVCASRIDGITAGGDSGGPMFASGRQVGVASTSDRATRTAYTNITRYRSWIQSIAGV